MKSIHCTKPDVKTLGFVGLKAFLPVFVPLLLISKVTKRNRSRFKDFCFNQP